jgi:hypothetical protein
LALAFIAGTPRDNANKITKIVAPKALAIYLPLIHPLVTPVTNTVTFAWDASPSTVARYRLHQGLAPRTYTNSVDCGLLLSNTIPVSRNVTNYFAVTAYTTNGLESDYSNEIMLAPPSIIPVYGLLFIQGSTDLTAWVDLTPQPFLRLTNGFGGPLSWQWFRSRTEIGTNWR